MNQGSPALLRRWLTFGEWRAHPVRAVVAAAAIALGVALGFAIHLINAAAYNEFSAAIKSLSGQADLQVRGTQAYFDERFYEQVTRLPAVATASPVLEVDAAVPGRQGALKVLGIDVFQAGAIAPDLIGVPAEDRAFDTLADDAVFLSPAAMEWLQVRQGDTVHLRAGTQAVRLRVAGGLIRARAGQRLAVMDIGAAQWRFQRLGRLSHIELKLQPGIDRNTFKTSLAAQLPTGLLVTETEDQEARTANMSRAYRVNLNMLALVALFTGTFLVFSTQALSVLRRRGQLALLRVTGMTRREILRQILAEGAVLGIAGSVAGLAAGYAIAAAALRFFGGDLGGGYFPGVQPSVQFSFPAAAAFFLLGTSAGLLGCASPAWEAARARPAQALKSGSEDVALSRLATPWPSLTCLAAGAAVTLLPPVFELPLFGYLAIAFLLIGGIGLMPRMAALVFSRLSRASLLAGSGAVPSLALGRLANAPNQASIALGGVLSSFSLMVAMAIMVASFRVSVDDWLSHILSADMYVRAATGGNTATFSRAEQQAIAGTPGIARADFQRLTQLVLDPSRPSVALIARPVDIDDPGRMLPLVGPSLAAGDIPAGDVPVWGSEAMTDLYGFRPGERRQLPIAGRTHKVFVAGIWRDYVRQSGAIQMRLADYRRMTGDEEANDAAIRLQPDATTEEVIAAMRRLPFGDVLEFAEPEQIRAISLRIFDRSFAVTYLLEAVAIVIGLFGVAATFSAQTLARAKEFGMLRHIGLMRRQILAMLAVEGGLLTLLGIVAGFLLGGAISLILIFVVNPQSFHWTMQLHMPWTMLASVAALLLVSASLTALAAGRYAVSGDAVRAVREDW